MAGGLGLDLLCCGFVYGGGYDVDQGETCVCRRFAESRCTAGGKFGFLITGARTCVAAGIG